jgi:hypothetical protein
MLRQLEPELPVQAEGDVFRQEVSLRVQVLLCLVPASQETEINHGCQSIWLVERS